MTSSKVRVVVGLFVIHLITNQYLEAVPTPTARTEHVPWAQPCTPSLSDLYRMPEPENRTMATVNMNRDENVVSLTSKTKDTIQRGKVIQQLLMDIFQDNYVKEMIRTKNLFGFPQVVLERESQQQTTGNMFRIIYTQLSQAAVFLDQIHQVQSDGELKDELQAIVSDNLSLMCELQIVLLKVGLYQPTPANRSIMGDLPSSMSTFQRNVRCLNIIFKYKALLTSHLLWYHRIMAVTNSRIE